MNAKWVALATFLAGSSLTLAQEIVLKSSFTSNEPLSSPMNRIVVPVDVNDDGVPEIPTLYGFLDKTNWHEYKVYDSNLSLVSVYYYPQQSDCSILANTRRLGVAELVISRYGYVTAFDVATNDVLLSVVAGDRFYVLDYDQDGLDDICIQSTGSISVYGISTGNPPISSPQDLVIQTAGNDYVITWSAVPMASAYRVEWSSALDGGVRFTRIGYTQETSFIHRNQVGQERGFYRVLSEDNGTGLVRMVGTSTLVK